MTLDAPLLNPFPALLAELKVDIDLIAQVADRIRADEPAADDVQPRQSWRKFVVLNTLSAPPDLDLPVTFATYGVKCYGATFKDAWAVYAAFVAAVHQVGPRLKQSGLGIYQTLVTGGGSEEKDPDTRQPFVTATISLIATARAVTA